MALQQLADAERPIKRLQALITESAFRRLRVEAARRDCTIGDVITRLAQQLPAVEVAIEPHSSQTPVEVRA